MAGTGTWCLLVCQMYAPRMCLVCVEVGTVVGLHVQFEFWGAEGRDGGVVLGNGEAGQGRVVSLLHRGFLRSAGWEEFRRGWNFWWNSRSLEASVFWARMWTGMR